MMVKLIGIKKRVSAKQILLGLKYMKKTVRFLQRAIELDGVINNYGNACINKIRNKMFTIEG